MVNLEDKLSHIFSGCRTLLETIVALDLPTAGNIAVFAQSENEYAELSKLVFTLIHSSNNPNQKYFELVNPIILTDGKGAKATFTYIYIRKPDPSDYGKYLGDVDFIMSPNEYEKLKQKIILKKYPGAIMYDRPGWDTIQLTLPEIDVVSYISTKAMAEKARVKFDSLTKL